MSLLGPQMSSSHAAESVKFPSGEILQREVGSEEGGPGIQSDIAPSHPISMACLAARRKQFDWGGDKRQEMVSFCSGELLTRNAVCREVWSVSVRIIWHEQGKPLNFVAHVFKTIEKPGSIEIDFLQSKADLYDPNAFFAKELEKWNSYNTQCSPCHKTKSLRFHLSIDSLGFGGSFELHKHSHRKRMTWSCTLEFGETYTRQKNYCY